MVTEAPAFLDLCEEAGANVEAIRSVFECKRNGRLMPMESRWYASLEQGTPDYAIYDEDAYLGEAWACWMNWSRAYLRWVQRKGVFRMAHPKRIADLGCGIGWTTLTLAMMHPRAEVFGTQRLDSTQARVAQLLSEQTGVRFTIVGELADVGEADAVFASEYFEHFAEPVAHLRDVLALKPRVLVHASTFGIRSPGHFDNYTIDGKLVPGGRMVGRAFAGELRTHEYRMIATGWKGRPTAWAK